MAGDASDRARRWRLVLGGGSNDGTGVNLEGADLGRDRALQALYDSERRGGLGPSAPNVARWLGDIREYFPSSVVRVMQKDALDRLHLQQMLLEPEMLASVEPDVNLIATLLSLRSVLPNRTKDTARAVVRKVVDDLIRRLDSATRQAVTGALNRSIRNRRPRLREIDWDRTIRANLRHYQPDWKTVVPETRIGFGHRRSSMRDLILCVDQSGSMASSVVYAGVFGAVLASIPAVSTRMIAFDTSVVDLTENLTDPVELLFGIQLGGGTDIHLAMNYCQTLIQRPTGTILVLISDLYEGGDAEKMIRRVASIVASGVKMIALLTLSDDGKPAYDHAIAAKFSALGVPSFACTPDRFPELMAEAIKGGDIEAVAARWTS